MIWSALSCPLSNDKTNTRSHCHFTFWLMGSILDCFGIFLCLCVNHSSFCNGKTIDVFINNMNSVPFRLYWTSGHNKSWHEIRKLVSLLLPEQTLIPIHRFIMRENIRINQNGNDSFLFLFPVQTKWPNKQFDINQKIDFSPSNAWGMGHMTRNTNGSI